METLSTFTIVARSHREVEENVGGQIFGWLTLLCSTTFLLWSSHVTVWESVDTTEGMLLY